MQPVSTDSAEAPLAGLSRAQHGPPSGEFIFTTQAYPPEGRPGGHGTSPLSASSAPRAFKVCTEDLMQVKLAWTASCKQGQHGWPNFSSGPGI